jgi:predicted RNase H-like nuclease
VFAAPCRATLSAWNHADASATNRQITGRGLSQQGWGIVPKIKEVDDAFDLCCQKWVFEVHPEVCFWAEQANRFQRVATPLETTLVARTHLKV